VQHLSSYVYYGTPVVNCFKVAFFDSTYNIVYSSKLATASALRLGRLTVRKARIKKMEQRKLHSVIMDLRNSILTYLTIVQECHFYS
jgi:hypothetical protein